MIVGLLRRVGSPVMITTLSLHLLDSHQYDFFASESWQLYGTFESAATFLIRAISSTLPASGMIFCCIASSR